MAAINKGTPAMIRTAAFAALFAAAMPAFADGPLDSEQAAPAQVGPTVGAPAPALAAVASDGAGATLASVSGQNGVALVFVRSADWCPFCKTQLVDLEPAAEGLAAAGWPVAAISYDAPETLAGFKADKGLSYTLLSDEGSAMIDAFGLRNAEVKAGSRFDGIPHPAVVFIRKDGAVAAVLREEGYRDRPQVEAIQATAALLNEAAG